jgi:UDPglucose--hexose-1-phosphate uridylyltransferase
MPELRKDPIIGRWVIVATERARRPDQFMGKPKEEQDDVACPFCEGREASTPSEIYALRPRNSTRNGPGWDLRVVPSISPLLKVEGNLERRGNGIYDVMNGLGAHEIVVETNQHIANMADLSEEQIAKVLNCYSDRIVDLERDSRIKYVLVFKNYGQGSGSTRIKHARSQLIATPVNPKRVKEELAGSRLYYEYHERCVFCDLIQQELDQKERIILDCDGFVAVSPFAARFPFETWVLPKQHCCDYTYMNADSRRNLARLLKAVLLKLKIGLNDPDYNYIIHTAPFRREKVGYWKTIEYDYHWHIEIMPRLTKVAGFEWGTGFYICPVPPEDTAKFLREVKI